MNCKKNRKRNYPRLTYPFRVPGYGQIVSPRAFRLFQLHYRRLVFAHAEALRQNEFLFESIELENRPWDEPMSQEEFLKRIGVW